MRLKCGVNGIVLVLLIGTLFSCHSSNDNLGNENLFPKGEKINSENFIGTVWLQMIKDETDTALHLSMGNVTFEPGARTNWHSHPGGQVLLVTKGKGWYQEKGKPVEIIKKGDVVKCPPNIEHWHGATPSDTMTHMAISLNTDKGGAVWLGPVTEEEYTE